MKARRKTNKVTQAGMNLEFVFIDLMNEVLEFTESELIIISERVILSKLMELNDIIPLLNVQDSQIIINKEELLHHSSSYHYTFGDWSHIFGMLNLLQI